MRFQIGDNWVGDGCPVFVVAEIGQNHNGDVYTASRLCGVAADAGCDAVKFCKRDLDNEYTASFGARPYDNEHSYGATYHEHRLSLELSPSDYRHIKERIAYNAWPLVFFSTACHPAAVDDLMGIGVPAFKIASRDLTNEPLLRHVAKTGKPVILSCGLFGPSDIRRAIETIRTHGRHNDIVLLQCTSLYPTSTKYADLAAIRWLRDEFEVLVGFSDHTEGIDVAPLAVAHGACVIEKHITFSKSAKGTDHAGSAEPHELKEMVRRIRVAEQAAGMPYKRLAKGLAATRAKLCRSLVTTRVISEGESITEQDLTLKSPGDGFAWQERHKVIGTVASRDIEADETIYADMIEMKREWVSSGT